MHRSWIGFIASAAVLATFSTAAAAPIVGAVLDTYSVQNVTGNQSPPPYGLRLDGLFGNSPVLFGFTPDSVFQTYNTDGSLQTGTPSGRTLAAGADKARLFGSVILLKNGNQSLPAVEQIWSVDVMFDYDGPGKSGFTNWVIDGGNASELVNLVDGSTIDLISKYAGGVAFEVGGPNGSGKPNTGFGANGWVDYLLASDDGILIKRGGSSYGNTADFLMSLAAVPGNGGDPQIVSPEPTSIALFATVSIVGLVALGRSRVLCRPS